MPSFFFSREIMRIYPCLFEACHATLFATSCEWGERFVHRLLANEGSGWQVIPNNPQYLSEYREILEALKGNTFREWTSWDLWGPKSCFPHICGIRLVAQNRATKNIGYAEFSADPIGRRPCYIENPFLAFQRTSVQFWTQPHTCFRYAENAGKC